MSGKMSSPLQTIQSFVNRYAGFFTFTEVAVQSRLGEAYFSYICDISVGEAKARGYGTARGKSQAFLAALGEGLERYFFQQQQRYRTSNGFASHTDPEKALENAKRELIERDAFLRAYHLAMPLRDITRELMADSEFIAALGAQIVKAGFQFSFGLLRDQEDFCVVAAVYPVRAGCVLGLSCKTSLPEAAEKAMLEAFINAHVDPSLNELTLEAFLEMDEAERQTPLAHLRLGLGPSLAHRFFRQLKPKASVVNLPIDEKSFVIERIATEPWLPDCPFTLVKASHPHLQDLYFGPPSAETLRLLSSQGGGDSRPHYLPHILG